MQRFKGGAVVLVVFLVTACASQPDVPEETFTYSTESPDAATLQSIRAQATSDPVATPAAVARVDEVVCSREAPTGSNIRVRRCYTRRQMQDQAKSAQDWLADELSQSGTSRDGAVFAPTTE